MFSIEIMAELGRYFAYLIMAVILVYSFTDLLQRPGMSNNSKVKWLFVILFVPVFGWVYYLYQNKK